MLQKIILLLIMMAVFNDCISQANYKYSYPIKIDYKSGVVKLDTNKRGLPKALNVGQILQISIINLPEKFSVNALTVFENDKMESASIFNGFVGAGLEAKESDKSEPKDSNNNETKAVEEDAKAKQQEKSNEDKKNSTSIQNVENETVTSIEKYDDIKNKGSLDTNNIKLKKIIDKKYKTDIDNLKNYLNLGDVKNYLKELSKIDEKDKFFNFKILGSNISLQKALVDLNFQQEYLLRYVQDNINDRKRINDSARTEYASRIDSLQNILNGYLTTQKSIEKNLLGVQILNRDYTNITIEVKDSNNKTVNILPLSFNNHKGFKIDFSTGIFNTFRKTYSYDILNATSPVNGVTTANDSTYKIKELNNGNNNLSIGILLHGYWRHFNYANFGPALGFSYSLESKELNLLVGCSLLIGKEQRFVVNAGFAFSKYKELTLYNTTDTYHKSVLNTSTDLKLTNKVRSSPFIGVTYNLGAIKTKTETRILN